MAKTDALDAAGKLKGEKRRLGTAIHGLTRFRGRVESSREHPPLDQALADRLATEATSGSDDNQRDEHQHHDDHARDRNQHDDDAHAPDVHVPPLVDPDRRDDDPADAGLPVACDLRRGQPEQRVQPRSVLAGHDRRGRRRRELPGR